jgi:hypothetical protein
MTPAARRLGADRRRRPSVAAAAVIAALAPVLAVAGCASCGGGARPAPIADRAIDLAGRCAQTEEDGFREDASLVVRANRVEALRWELWVGRRGSCRFELAEFTQVRSRPSIELAARDGSACRLMVWQEPRRVTLAHAGCEARCTAGIYEEAWPVMFEPRDGSCATR